jgi:hypothetical protein
MFQGDSHHTGIGGLHRMSPHSNPTTNIKKMVEEGVKEEAEEQESNNQLQQLVEFSNGLKGHQTLEKELPRCVVQ